ncbi:hypothetical protein A1O3_03689 [Capronia epimyces CBS 606.96]|uniref:DUF7924 domain-containing protein n=1 Tax=Capronia epimyces CBS 606.96 TaxID=1182542 RepID=W9YAP9_9EURO|nr:uncharacterized protein A1O3_03689 [Capronia epimyces CBS 606.96]EXJ86735.1 hypothetical protein A1O3_03689 [Capronia epimyces CBS 606.96]
MGTRPLNQEIWAVYKMPCAFLGHLFPHPDLPMLHTESLKKMARRAGDDASIRAEIMSIIAGEGRKQHCYASDRLFDHMAPLADDLPTPKPELYDGALPQQIDRRVRRDLGKHIVPCNNGSLPAAPNFNNTSLPIVPNFFIEGKSEGGRADVAKRQACHDGAVGARAMHSLQNYLSAEPTYDGNAYSYSSTYYQSTATLQLYAHHLTAPEAPGEPPEYHMTQLGAYAMTNNIATFRQGARGFRHLRDRAKIHRDAFIDHANLVATARGAPGGTASTTSTNRNSRTSLSVLQEDEDDGRTSLSALQEDESESESESDTSTDELAAEDTDTTAKHTRHATGEKSRLASIPTREAAEQTFS